MAINSREKGAVGEREVAGVLREHGFPDARRGQQFKGGTDSPDVVGFHPDWHPEVKRVERGNLYDWLDQAKRDAGPGKTPVVIHRRNRREWVAILPLEDFLKLIPRV